MSPNFEESSKRRSIAVAKGHSGHRLRNVDLTDDPVRRVLERLDEDAIEAAQQSIISNEPSVSVSRPRLRPRSLSDSSEIINAAHERSFPGTDAFKGVSKNRPIVNDTEMLRTIISKSRPRLDTAEFSPRHLEMVENHAKDPVEDDPPRPTKDGTMPVPARTSSRLEGSLKASPQKENGKRHTPKHSDSEDSESVREIIDQPVEETPVTPPRKQADPEAARRRMTKNKPAPAALRSATPPPIAKPRRYIIDEGYQSGHQASHHGGNPEPEDRTTTTTPITAIHVDETAEPSRSASRHPSMASSRQVSQTPGMRTPMLDHLQLYDDVERSGVKPRTDDRVVPSLADVDDDFRTLPDDVETVASFHGGNGSVTAISYQRPSTVSRRTYDDDTASISKQSFSRRSDTTYSSNRMPDFFGRGIFQVVLHNPTTAHQLLKFSETRFSSENVEFLGKVEQYRQLLNDLATILSTIHKTFIADQSPSQVNVSETMLKVVHSEMKGHVLSTLPALETLFTDMQDQIEHFVFTEIYPRFVRFQLTLSASKALATDRFRYQGLGDCFCLTNPSKADNPIVFASDGFVKVTGYRRPEIIPRNCRFLQGSHTDREPVRRLKSAIDERRESVELLLNYKKNGDPFWNLLYVAPLYNEMGKVAFFLGGQVNCSTTIHTNADVMRVLSTSGTNDIEQEKQPQQQVQHRTSALPAARKALMKAFGVRVEDPHIYDDAGMEQKVLDRMEGQDLKSQMIEFYTAYSKYLVVRADTFIIKFFSEGVTEILHPANNTAGMISGEDVFRFFKQNMVATQSEYKSRVRAAVRAGQPISIELRLQTRRSAMFRGDEKFMAHWTPLKDENASVHWVVVALAPAIS